MNELQNGLGSVEWADELEKPVREAITLADAILDASPRTTYDVRLSLDSRPGVYRTTTVITDRSDFDLMSITRVLKGAESEILLYFAPRTGAWNSGETVVTADGTVIHRKPNTENTDPEFSVASREDVQKLLDGLSAAKQQLEA